tara:strand:+ start:3001 stop:3249 length:249 start_codon:yes stop_codon:yes gene_type:complete
MIVGKSLFHMQLAHGEILGLSKGRGCEAYSYAYKRMQPTREHEKQAKFMLKSFEQWRVNPVQVEEMYKLLKGIDKLTKELMM